MGKSSRTHAVSLFTLLALIACGSVQATIPTTTALPSQLAAVPTLLAGDPTGGATDVPPQTGSPRELELPPQATLAFAGLTQVGDLGSYCWFTASDAASPDPRKAQTTGCTDTIGIPVPDATLPITVGASLTFDLGGTMPFTGVGASAYSLAGQPLSTAGGRRWLPWARYTTWQGTPAIVRELVLPTTVAGQGATITATMPAGECVILVLVRTQAGDASYGFHISAR